MNLSEAFQKLDLLESEDFNISSAMDSADLKNFLTSDEITDDVDIIDQEAHEEDELEDSYVGKVVVDCCICHSKFYKNPEDIVMDDETDCCNIDEECPICFSQDGYKIIGKIAPYTDVDNSEIDTAEETNDSVDNEPIKEGIGGALLGGIAGGVTAGPIGAVAGAAAGNALGNALGKKNESVDKTCNKHLCAIDKDCLKEDFTSATVETDDSIMTLDSDDNGKVTVTNELKCDNCETTESNETIVPLEVEDAIEIAEQQPTNDVEDTADDEVDADIDDFDEESFDELGESYLKKVYENVNSYKTKSVRSNGNKIIVEGVIKFNSGKEKNTSFIFESCKRTRTGKLKFIGENVQITNGKKAFTITGNLANKKFMTESLNYNYRQRNANGRSTRLYGTIRR